MDMHFNKKNISENDIEAIVGDLIASNPEFAKDTETLKTIIKQLLIARPDTTIDGTFRASLKAQLLGKAITQPRTRMWGAHPFTVMQKFIYSLGGAGVAVVILLIVVYGGMFSGDLGNALSGKVEVKNTGEQAFGSLVSKEIVGLGEEATPFAYGFGAGGDVPLRSQSGGGSAAAFPDPSGLVIAPDIYIPIMYEYVYKGDALALPESAGVLKRVKGGLNATQAVSSLRRLFSGLLDPSSFSDLKLENFSLMEDTPFGYMISVGLQEGIVSIDRNFRTWPQPQIIPLRCAPNSECTGGGPVPLSIDQMLSDGEIIAIADTFLQERGISRDNYGAPEVMRYNYGPRPLIADAAMLPVFEEMSVVYPLRVDEKTVYHEDGNRSGLVVGVSLRYKRATSVYDLATRNYERSDYPAEQDLGKLMQFAKNRNWFGPEEAGTKKISVELGTPTQGYVRMWLPPQEGKGYEGQEVLVEAYVFPVLNPTPEMYVDRIVIPLAKEIIEQRLTPPSFIIQ